MTIRLSKIEKDVLCVLEEDEGQWHGDIGDSLEINFGIDHSIIEIKKAVKRLIKMELAYTEYDGHYLSPEGWALRHDNDHFGRG